MEVLKAWMIAEKFSPIFISFDDYIVSFMGVPKSMDPPTSTFLNEYQKGEKVERNGTTLRQLLRASRSASQKDPWT